MIKKLKRRFLIIYMVIISCFLITILTGIYFIVYRSELTHSQQIMEMAIENNTRLDYMNSSPPKKIINFDDGTVTITTAGYNRYVQNEFDVVDMSSEFLSDDDSHYSNFEDVFKNDNNNDFKKFHHNDDNNYFSQDNFNHEPPNNDWFNSSPPNKTQFIDDNLNIPSTPPLDTIVADEKFSTDIEQVTSLTTEVPMDVSSQRNSIMPSEDTPVVTDSENVILNITEDIQISTTETTIEQDTITESTSTVITKEKILDDRPKNKPIMTEYEGNLARNTIYVRVSKDGDIQRISYQYFESSDNISLEQTVKEIIKNGSMAGKIEIDNIKFRYAVFTRDAFFGYDIIFLDRAIEISTLNRLLIIFISIGGLGLVILFGVSWLLASWAITPIVEAWDKQKQFIADASHELKTPLTVIATNTDVVLANADDTVQNQSKWLTYIKSETARMSKLVSDLLYIAKSDINEVAMVMNRFNLSHTTLGVCLVFETVAFENGKILDTDIEENIYFKGDEDRIKQLINILLDNAIVHSEGNANIMVSLKRDIKDKIKISVSNTNGEDIPKDYEERLFERFFRVDKARNRSNGSYGLGLNIAQSIVKNHDGSISVTSTRDHLVTFTVTL